MLGRSPKMKSHAIHSTCLRWLEAVADGSTESFAISDDTRPSKEQLKDSAKYLQAKGLIQVEENRFTLTVSGLEICRQISLGKSPKI